MAAPTTTFEVTGGAEWTPLEEEATFLQTIAAETSAVLTSAGESVQGRPLWRVDIGGATARTLTVVASQHANERAPREAALQWIRQLAYSTDPAVVDYLANHRVVVLPLPNPDGFALGRMYNADSIDVNRDVYRLRTPEQRAIQAVIRDTRPNVFLDCHEQSSTVAADITYRGAETAALYPGLGSLGDELISAIATDLDAAGIENQLFDIPGRFSLREAAAMHHTVSLLIESWFGSGSDRQKRVADYLVTLESVRTWHGDNAQRCADVAEASRTYQESTTGRYVLQHGTTNFPWPQTLLPDDLIGYDLNEPLSSRFVDAYGIVVDGGRVALSQQARAVIPILLDEASDDQVIDTTRVLDDDSGPPGPDAPIGEILPSGTFSPVVTWLGCDLLTGRIIAELPEVTGNIGRLLGAYTSANLSTPIPSGVLAKLAVQATVPMRTMIVAVVNNQPCWAGIVLTRQRGTGATMDLATATPEVYLNRRTVRDHNWRGRDEASVIAAGLVRDAGDIPGVGRGIGLEIDAPRTGRNRKREYAAMDRATVYDRLRELMGVRNGPEFTIEPMWGDDDQTRVRLVVRIRSRIGIASTRPRAVFDSRGASSASYTLTEDYSDGKGANYVMASSSGEGEDKPTSAPAVATDMLNAGWPIVEHHFEPGSNISNISTLNEHAQRELELLARGANVWTIDARWNVYPSLNIDWRIGDDIAWNLTGHGHPDGTTGTGRCIGWELRPSEGTVSPILLNPQEGTT